MRIHRGGEQSSTYGGRFTGAVSLEMLHEAQWEGDPDVARVHFEDGAVTNWHAHPGGQHLLLLEGAGCVGTGPDGEVALQPGTFVHAPAGERHYHGAQAGADCTFLAITWGTTDWEDEAPSRG
jgi:quercetin dioxygenase-like cupin family protein